MRKSIRIFLFLGFVASSSLAFSQAQVAVGIKGGLNFAKLNVDDGLSGTYSSRTGYHGGAFLLVKVTKIGIQPEIIFSQQGSKFSFNSQDMESNFSYLNIPVILKLYLVAGLNLQAGPQFGFLTSAESNYDPLSTNPTITSSTDVKDLYKKSDVSAALGAGWDLPFGLTLDARYNLGITKNENGANTNATKNQLIQVSLGYKIIKIGK